MKNCPRLSMNAVHIVTMPKRRVAKGTSQKPYFLTRRPAGISVNWQKIRDVSVGEENISQTHEVNDEVDTGSNIEVVSSQAKGLLQACDLCISKIGPLESSVSVKVRFHREVTRIDKLE